MTENEWNNLKVGGRVVCRFDDSGLNCYGELATISNFSKFYCGHRIDVLWDNKKCNAPSERWSYETSFDLVEKKKEDSEYNILSGGVSI